MAIRDATSSRWGHSAWAILASRTCCGHAPSRRKPAKASRKYLRGLALVERRHPPRSRPSDPKMTAPVRISVAPPAQSQTNVPGIETGGGSKRMARLADKMAFVRVLRTHSSGHGGGTVWMHTGLPIAPENEAHPWGIPAPRLHPRPRSATQSSRSPAPAHLHPPQRQRRASSTPLAGQPIHCIRCPQGQYAGLDSDREHDRIADRRALRAAGLPASIAPVAATTGGNSLLPPPCGGRPADGPGRGESGVRAGKSPRTTPI